MSDMTFGPSFKVKQWFSGFGELSFRWIQICIGSPMRRSRFSLVSPLSTTYPLSPASTALTFENNLQKVMVHESLASVKFDI